VVEISGGTLPAPTIIATDRVNTCAPAASGETLCSGASGTFDVIAPGGNSATTTSAQVTTENYYTAGGCVVCGAAVDNLLNLGILATGDGFKTLDLNTNELSAAIPANNEPVPPVFGYDPTMHRILSANYHVTNLSTFASSSPKFQIFDLTASPVQVYDLPNSVSFFEPAGHTCTGTSGNTSTRDTLPETTAIDTSTQIAYVTFHTPSACFGNAPEDIALFDLKQATFTAGSPTGTWNTAGKQIETLSEVNFGGGIQGLSIVSNTHLALMGDQGTSSVFGVLRLPSSSGSGVPAVQDWVVGRIPRDPSGAAWTQWRQPDGVASYQSPNTGHSMGVMMNNGVNGSGQNIGPTYLAIIDLDAALAASRSSAHTLSSSVNVLSSGIVRFVQVQ
jgi:hypothetical protein